MVRAEVWMVALPLAGGREQGGERPAIIVQSATVGQSLPLVIVVPLTSQSAASRFPGTVRIRASAANGLSSDSVGLAFQIRAVDRSRFVRKLGSVSEIDIESVFQALDKLFGRT